jgi:hypothetical protein
MSRLTHRVRTLERNTPRLGAKDFFESLNDMELRALILAMHRFQLQEAKSAGDKALAADLAVVIKHDQTLLSTFAPEKLPTKKSVAELLQLCAALDDDDQMRDYSGPDYHKEFRERVRRDASDIRFNDEFFDIFDRLEAGETVEYFDVSGRLIASVTKTPRSDRTWKNFDFSSPFIPPVKRYQNPRPRDPSDGWKEWRDYCREAERISKN